MKIMQEAYKKLLKKVEKIEREYGSLEEFIIASTFLGGQHKMRMADFSSAWLGKVQHELSPLELADLIDFQKCDGRFDGEHF